jgi:hypothetical protein
MDYVDVLIVYVIGGIVCVVVLGVVCVIDGVRRKRKKF